MSQGLAIFHCLAWSNQKAEILWSTENKYHSWTQAEVANMIAFSEGQSA